MVGLIDIVPATESVVAGGESVTVHGVSASGIAHLLGRFPDLLTLMAGKEIGTEKLIAMGGEAVGAIIAAGCGYPGNSNAESIASRLPVGEQTDLLSAILRLTMPQGVGPFVEKLAMLGGILNVDKNSAPAAPVLKVPTFKSRRRSTN